MGNKKYLNLGCGQRFHKDWVNIDFISNSPHVIAHDLHKGLPFPDASFDVVYHSHVLEHFTQEHGRKLIAECARVLKKGGIIRIALPDLENIARTYLILLRTVLKGNTKAERNYDWILLELFDQVARNESGGEMARFLLEKEVGRNDFIAMRIGTDIIRQLKTRRKNSEPTPFKRIVKQIKALLKKNRHVQYYLIGRFRNRGEIHFQMYDRFSLTRLLMKCGFANIRIMSAFKSNIPGWKRFELDVKDHIVHAPLSLFMEAVKK